MKESPLKIYILAAVFSVLPILAVMLRYVARWRTKMQLLWDDWTIVFALVSCITTAVLLIIGAAAGLLAQHVMLDPDTGIPVDYRYYVFEKTMYAIALTQLLSIGPTKLSVLFFYLRIFGRSSPTFTILNCILIILTLMWTISFFFANVFKCSPVDSEMVPNPPVTSHCIDEPRMLLGQAYSDVGLDVLILSLPVPMIYKIHLSWTKKIGVMCMFLLGALTTAASITRALYQSAVLKVYDAMMNDDGSQDLTYWMTPMIYWPFIESSLGIIGACLPLYRPLADMHFIKYIVRRINKAAPSDGFAPLNQDGQSDSPPVSGSEDASKKDSDHVGDRWLRACSGSVYDEDAQPNIELSILSNDARS